MFTSKLMIPGVIIGMALIIVILLLIQRNTALESKLDKVRWELRQEKNSSDYLRNQIIEQEYKIKRFTAQQTKLNAELQAQQAKQQAAEAKLNEVLNDESVKDWGDGVVPIAVSRLFNQPATDGNAASGPLPDRADVPANKAEH